MTVAAWIGSWVLASLMFTLVPPSSNPRAKLNRDLQKKLRDNLHADLLDIQKGRIRFSPTLQTPSFDKWTQTLSTAKSIRWIVTESDNFMPSDDETMIADKIYNCLRHVTLDSILTVYRGFGNSLPTNDRVVPTFDLSCRRWNCSVIPKDAISTTTLSHQLRGVVAHCYGWQPYRRQLHGASSAVADLDFHVVLSENGCFVELVLMAPPKFSPTQDLPRPGCKRVEAWMLVQSCDIRDGHVVLDPLCGKGTFLVEAATTLHQQAPQARYIGVDQSAEQLQDARQNVDETGTSERVVLHQGDARRLDFLPTDSVDVVLTCPPFGKQYGMEILDLAVFYRECLTEWIRVCKGRLVVLIDVENAEAMVQAMRDTKVLQLEVHREPFRLGRLLATVLVATRIPSCGGPASEPLAALSWEGRDPLTRASWMRLRATSLPSLVPHSSSL